ncbi:hypothetical protein OESDEN_00054 [Oesophagostomum dentatum]|uniref:CUB domain-containing protein n=1 Tax=Oesophagostomum dentatum TaxID=61180 RepID=A0A0B1TV21_OESDE|nr:hypothetical protein OESDEN_00054 [Oesophagostomum dentatum]
MVYTAVFLLASAISLAQALSFYTRHQMIECGSRINTEGSYRLPKHERCSIKVEVPENTAVQITASGRDFKCRRHLNDLMVISTETKLPSFPCLDRVGAAVFTGVDKEYVINTRDLPAGTHIGISYYSTNFECGDSVPFDVAGIPLTLSYKNAENGNCVLVLPGRARAVIDKVEGAEVCLQFSQGLRLGDFSLRSERVCHRSEGSSPLSYDVFCSIGILSAESASDATIHFRIEAPTPEQLDSYRIESFACSSRFID